MKRIGAFLLVLVLLVTSGTGWAHQEELIEELKEYIANYYIERVDVDSLPDSSPQELLEALEDRYTYYLSEQDYRDLQRGLEGNIGEIGIYIEQVRGYATVQIVMNGSEAEVAGLKSGDQILAINERSVVGLPLSQVVLLLKKEEADYIKLTVRRGEEILNLNVKSGSKPESVGWARLNDTTGYIRISTFGLETYQDFLRVVQRLNTDYYIIDLRDNGGGYLSVALNIVRELVPRGPILQIEDRMSGKRVYTAAGPGVQKPIVLLTNQYTGSAAEIMASALRDSGIGIIVGQPTFGKASIQSLFNLTDGGVLRLTTARYYTAGGGAIDKIGIYPDHLVADPEKQLQTAIDLLQGKVIHRFNPIKHGNLLVLTIGDKIVDINRRRYVIDVPPFIYQERTYVPLRLIAQSMNTEVHWREDTREVVLTSFDQEIVLPVDYQVMVVNGVEQFLEVPVIIRDDRTLVPVRFVAQHLNAFVHWESGKVYIDYPLVW